MTTRLHALRRPFVALSALALLLVVPACGSSGGGGGGGGALEGRVISGTVSLPESISAVLEGSPVTLSTLNQDGLEEIASTTVAADGSFEFPPIQGRDDETLVPVASIVDALTGLPAGIGGLVPPDAPGTTTGRTTQSKLLDGGTQIACVAGILLVTRDGSSPVAIDNSTVNNLELGAERFVASTDFTDSDAVADSADATLVITDGGTMAPARTGVSVTLTWQGTQDLDLRVFDPSGEEIFFANPTSDSGGSLDVDDRDGFGPENISWPAGGAPRGTYVVDVDYFAGSGNTGYTVTIEVSGRVQTFIGVIGEGDRIRIANFDV